MTLQQSFHELLEKQESLHEEINGLVAQLEEHLIVLQRHDPQFTHNVYVNDEDVTLTSRGLVLTRKVWEYCHGNDEEYTFTLRFEDMNLTAAELDAKLTAEEAAAANKVRHGS